jgi:hypothetical protein
MNHAKHVRLCRLVLRRKYVSPNQISSTFGLGYSEEQLQYLADTLPDTDTLALLGERGFILASTLPLPKTSFDILQLGIETSGVLFNNYSGLRGNDFFDEAMPAAEWIAINLEDARTANLDFERQKRTLLKGERVASLAQSLYIMMIEYCINNHKLCTTHRVRTCNTLAGGARVYIGDFAKNGPMINWDNGNFSNADCLLATSFKLSNSK